MDVNALFKPIIQCTHHAITLICNGTYSNSKSCIRNPRGLHRAYNSCYVLAPQRTFFSCLQKKYSNKFCQSKNSLFLQSTLLLRSSVELKKIISFRAANITILLKRQSMCLLWIKKKKDKTMANDFYKVKPTARGTSVCRILDWFRLLDPNCWLAMNLKRNSTLL